MNMHPSYFKDIPGMTNGQGESLGKAQKQVNAGRQILVSAPKSLAVGEVKALYDEAAAVSKAFGNRVPAAVAARARLLYKLVVRAGNNDTAMLAAKPTAQVVHVLALLWQAMDVSAQRARISISIGKTLSILANARKRTGAAPPPKPSETPPARPDDGGGGGEGETTAMVKTEPGGEVTPAKKPGLPLWAWLLIAIGGIGALTTVLVLIFRKKDGDVAVGHHGEDGDDDDDDQVPGGGGPTSPDE